MALAARHAASDYLLFTDADILFRPDAHPPLSRASGRHRCRPLRHSSHADRQDHGEGMLLGFLQVLGLWATRPWRASDPKATRDFIGIGAFCLLRASAYQQLGGFDALRMEILEDLTLARRVKLARSPPARRRFARPGQSSLGIGSHGRRQRDDEKSLRRLPLSRLISADSLCVAGPLLLRPDCVSGMAIDTHSRRHHPRGRSPGSTVSRDASAASPPGMPILFPVKRGTLYLQPAALDVHHAQTGRSHLAGHLLPAGRTPQKYDPIQLDDRPELVLAVATARNLSGFDGTVPRSRLLRVR